MRLVRKPHFLKNNIPRGNIYLKQNTELPKLLSITSNASHIASQIPYVNQRLLSKWLPEDTKKCMGSEIKSYFLAV